MGSQRVVIVVGATLRAEEADRPLAYRLRDAIDAWKQEHAEVLGVTIDPIVCSDLWYLNDEALRTEATVCIGGMGVNALSAYLGEHLDDEHKFADVLMQIDPDYTDLRVVIWGLDNMRTRHGVELFIERYLDGYLRAVATQVEPET